MNEPRPQIEIEGRAESREPPHLRPGETLRWRVSIDGGEPTEIQAIECSVLWYTEGKGDEDLAVHFFERLTVAELESGEIQWPRTFQTELPPTPLSYSGVIVKIRWCIRLRVFFKSGRDACAEQTFVVSSQTRGGDADGEASQQTPLGTAE